MFWNKKASTKQVLDRKSIVPCVENHTAFLNYSPVDYMFDKNVLPEKMFKKIDSLLANLLPENIDAGNCDMFDQLVLADLVQSEAGLREQFLSHQKIIRQLCIRRDADFTNVKLLKESLEEEIRELKLQLSELE